MEVIGRTTDLPLVSRPRFECKRPVPDWLLVVLLGIVEGITEFLPISSTAHLLICERFLPGGDKYVGDDLFNIVIQCGAVLAVVPLFRHRFSQLTHWQDPKARDWLAKIAVAFLITAAGGLVLDKLDFQLPETALPIAMAMLIGGLLILLVEGFLRGRVWSEEVTWLVVFTVGGGQLLAAIFPGASRSGTTILLSLLLGLSRPAATEFSFLVGIPTMLAAGGWKILKALRKVEDQPDWGMVFLGTVVAAAVSFIVVKWLLRFVQTHTFVGFGWYRIIAGGLLLFLALK
jgi:undecaprenyl-diphosphatase